MTNPIKQSPFFMFRHKDTELSPLDIEKYIFAHTNHNSDKRSIHIISTNFTPCFEVEWLLL